MLENSIVINTGPLISIVAATGSLDILNQLYDNVYVPYEVRQEISNGVFRDFALKEFNEASFLNKVNVPRKISPFLSNVLDLGEASVIQMALDQNIKTVCIDEKVGRRVAKLNNLLLTGSIGIMIKAKNNGYIHSMKNAISGMNRKGIYLSENIISFALNKAGEI